MASKVTNCRIERTGYKRQLDNGGRFTVPKKIREQMDITDDMSFECCIIRVGNETIIGFTPDVSASQKQRQKVCTFLRALESTMSDKVVTCVYDGEKMDGPNASVMAAKLYANGKQAQLISSSNQTIGYVYKEAIANGKGETFHVGTNKEFLYGYKINDSSVLMVLSPNKEYVIASDSMFKLAAEAVESILSCFQEE